MAIMRMAGTGNNGIGILAVGIGGTQKMGGIVKMRISGGSEKQQAAAEEQRHRIRKINNVWRRISGVYQRGARRGGNNVA